LLGLYFFKDSKQYINNHKTIECFCSVLLNNNYKELFINQFNNILKEFIKLLNIKYLIFENISHNYLLLNKLKLNKCLGIMDYYYYFYNYSMRPLNSQNCFILN
jgi:hemerythrin superfamily protein